MTVDGHTDRDEFNYRPDPGSVPDVMSMPFWSLAMCIAWIAWRDPHRVARASDEWRRWQGLPPISSFQRLCDNCEFGMFNISADPVPIEPVEELANQAVDAGRALYAALGCGDLNSYDAREDEKNKKPIAAADWTGLNPLFQLGELSNRQSDAFRNIIIQRQSVQDRWSANYSQEGIQVKTHVNAQDDPNEYSGPVRTGCPGRPTSRNFVSSELRRRCQAGEAASTLNKEAEYLENWLRRTHPTAPNMTVRTIENAIRHEYQELKQTHPTK